MGLIPSTRVHLCPSLTHDCTTESHSALNQRAGRDEHFHLAGLTTIARARTRLPLATGRARGEVLSRCALQLALILTDSAPVLTQC